MTGTATTSHTSPANVPRLELPCHESASTAAAGGATAGACAIDASVCSRQLNVILGRSHHQRTPRRDVVFNVKHGRMTEKQRIPLAMESSLFSRAASGNDGDATAKGAFAESTNTSSHWKTSAEASAPAFSPPARNEPKRSWYEDANKVFRFFGYIVDQQEPMARQAPTNLRLVIILYYLQDATLEMLESKETACAGIGRSLALRRPSRLPLCEIRVGADILVNGTRVHIYDADGFTRQSIPGLMPAESAPVPDKTFSITPRRGPPLASQDSTSSTGSCRHGVNARAGTGVGTRSSALTEDCPSLNGGSSSVISQDPPGILRMYIRWDEPGGITSPSVHRYILQYFLEDGTVEMRELADIKGGNYFEGRFPVMIRRQKLFRGGGSPSLSVDRIGGDHATKDATTPRSTRINDHGGNGGDGDGVGQPLTPLDFRVGRQVLLMKRPMIVCGWDETAHDWWEKMTGTSMRGLQGNLEDFRQCVRPLGSQPRPPNKLKSSFYEGPPQRSGTLREKFFKASENSGKTLRFLAKATQDTKTVSTRDNVFIIRFFPEDDALSVYTSHNLGKNSGGLQKGIYLARRWGMINENTGKPFKSSDFYIGSVTKLPSVSLEVVDVDDFTRHYLSMHTPPTDHHWQTTHMWNRLLDVAIMTGTGVRTGTPETTTASCRHTQDDTSLSSPSKNVTFDSNAFARFKADGNSFESCLDENGTTCGRSPAPTSADGCDQHEPSIGGSKFNERNPAIFARLWAECIGDDTCAVFTSDEGCPLGGTASTNNALNQKSLQPNKGQVSPAHFANHLLGPWERLVAALRNNRGIDVSQFLSAHEYIMLQREVLDWLQRAQGGQEARRGWEGGMAEWSSSRVDETFHRGSLSRGGTSDRHLGATNFQNGPCDGRKGAVGSISTSDATAVSKKCNSSGGFSNASEKRRPAEEYHFPMVVVEGGPSMTFGNVRGANEGGTGSGVLTDGMGDGGERVGTITATDAPRKNLDRRLDLLGVAVDAHEAPSTGREDRIVRRALARVLAHVFGSGGEASVRGALKADGKTPGDAADLWTMCRLMRNVAELSQRETEGLWLKFMPPAIEKAGDKGRVTFAGFLECIRAFEGCLRRGELLGLSTISKDQN